MTDIISVILGGGQGSRLFPLTKDRSKPAVPIGGKYRLIDIPISNCLNSNINSIFILTQFNSASLNKHITNTYHFDNFQKGFVDILAAEQSMESTDWYQGTADAVRKNIKHIMAYRGLKYVLILSGDQIYKMNFNKLLDYHIEKDADVTVSVLPCNREEAKAFGIVKMKNDLITDFIEKPKDAKLLDSLTSTDFIRSNFPNIEEDKEYVASMGIYLFKAEALLELLDSDFKDFGKEVIPFAIKNQKVAGYQFNGYWEDVGTIPSFLKSNLDFAVKHPKFDLLENRLFTNTRYLPCARVSNTCINDVLIAEGSVIDGGDIKRTTIGIRSVIGKNVQIENSIIMGADYFENEEEKQNNKKLGIIDIGIGDNTVIKNAIIDKNSRIGKNCKIVNSNNIEFYNAPNYYIRDKIIIIPKNATIPDNTEI